jgi:hypothetical protein
MSFLNRKGAAQYLTERGLPISPNTLQKKASTGGGPLYAIWGNKAVYRPQDLDAYAEQYLSAPRTSTSQAGG